MSGNDYKDATHINNLLSQWRRGDRSAFDELMTGLMEALEKIAHKKLLGERRGHTFQTGDLVNQFYLRLVNAGNVPWENCGQFLGSAAKIFTRILIDHARAHKVRPAGGRIPIDVLNTEEKIHRLDMENLLQFHELMQDLEADDEELALLAELRWIWGMTLTEIAQCTDTAYPDVRRQWDLLKKWVKLRARRK